MGVLHCKLHSHTTRTYYTVITKNMEELHYKMGVLHCESRDSKVLETYYSSYTEIGKIHSNFELQYREIHLHD